MFTIRLTIWLAILAYFIAEYSWIRWPNNRRSLVAWTVAYLLLLIHYFAAFSLHHHWSHAHAVAETASKTEAFLGFRFGGGVWINYIFALWWAIDLGLRYRSSAPTSGWWHSTFRIVAAFLVFQATVVFGELPAQIYGLIGFVALLHAWRCRVGN